MARPRMRDGLAVLAVIVVLAVIFGREVNGDDKPERAEIGLVEVVGPITSPEATRRQLRYLTQERDVSAIVLRIDSPGGAVGASQEIYRQFKRLRSEQDIVIVASMGNVAASGGYYIAAAADSIVANPGTVTGSIGVIAQFTQVDTLLRRVGLAFNTITSGRFKDSGSPFRPMRERERALFQGVIDDTYDQFVEAVAEGRAMTVEQVKEIADGRVLTGRQALAVGLVDALGNLDDAAAIARRMVEAPDDAPMIKMPARRARLMDYLVNRIAHRVGTWFYGVSVRYSLR